MRLGSRQCLIRILALTGNRGRLSALAVIHVLPSRTYSARRCVYVTVRHAWIADPFLCQKQGYISEEIGGK